MKLKITLLITGVWLALGGTAAGAEFDHFHALYGKVLRQFVTNGLVDYAALKKQPQDLNAYLDKLAAVSETQFNAWSQSEQIAFLVNLYNAATLKLIIDHYPIESIRKIGWLLKGPWDQEVVRLFGNKTTLDHVEHGLLRKKYNEPRIHFALVCAALGCPPLRQEPYLASSLDAQLKEQGAQFISNESKNRVDLKKRTVYLSPIFKWFNQDFEKKSGSVVKFVAPYFSGEAREALLKGGFRIRYTDYDWSLNDVGAR